MNNVMKRKNPFDMDTFFDDFFDGERKPMFNVMRADVKELENAYEIKVEVPGVKKEDIKMSLDNGYLNLETSMNNSSEEKSGHYIHKERYYGSFKRSFYVGENVAETDIKASLNDGVLNINVAKKENKPQKKFISIE